jgi:hypothetical protein
MLKKALALAGGLVLSSLAQADGIAVGVHGGLMGAGVDGYYRLSDKVVLRGSYNAFDYDYDTEEEDLDLEATYSFDNAALGVDWYPFAGGFRLSAAYVHNANELAMNAIPKGGTFDLNDNPVPYSGSEVKSLKMQVSYPESGAYVGLGWGNPVRSEKGFGVTFDVGAFYLGEPEVAQQVECGVTARCGQLKDDAEADRKKIEDELSDFPFWPMIQLGFTYQF